MRVHDVASNMRQARPPAPRLARASISSCLRYVGPGKHCSSRHVMPINARNDFNKMRVDDVASYVCVALPLSASLANIGGSCPSSKVTRNDGVSTARPSL